MFMRKELHNRTKRLSCALLLVLLLTAVLLSACGSRSTSSAWRIPNNDQVVRELRKALREHSREFTVRFSFDRDVLSELSDLAEDWVEQALQETDDPTEGD